MVIDTSDCVAVFDTGSPHMQMHRAFLTVIVETLGAVLVNETIDENPYTSVDAYKVICCCSF